MPKKIFIIIAILAATASSLSARQLSPAEAFNAALSSTAGTDAGRLMKVKSGLNPVPVKVGVKGDISTYYVFSNPSGGFLVAAADDVAAPLLGYSETSDITSSTIPDNMAQWLNFYNDEIAAAIEIGVVTRDRKVVESDYPAIPPLVTTRWDQVSPFNLKCPVVDGEHCVTGCSATALAQILNYWKYPQKFHGYAWGYYGDYSFPRNEYYLDLSTVSINWDDMLDDYITYTDAQADAVSSLMQVSGYAIQSSYHLNATGASTDDVCIALLNNFHYSKGIAHPLRNAFSTSDWIEMIYHELSVGRPVYYAGFSHTNGHAFVCDGYSPGGFFHFNWGWGGYCNGYFQLTALSPYSPNFLGDNYDYNDVITGITPLGNSDENTIPRLTTIGSLRPEEDIVTRSEDSVVNFSSSGYISNTSGITFDAVFGLKTTDQSGNIGHIETDVKIYMTPFTKSPLPNISVPSVKFPEGIYTIFPAFKIDTTWIDIKTNPNQTTRYLTTVTDSTVTLKPIVATAAVKTSLLEVRDTLLLDECNIIKATLEASGDFSDNLAIALLKQDETLYARIDTRLITIPDNGTRAVEWPFKFASSIIPGNYKFALINSKKEIVSDIRDVTLAPQSESADVAITQFEVTNATSGSGSPSDPYIMPASDVSALVTLAVDHGHFRDVVKLEFVDVDSIHSISRTPIEVVDLVAGAPVTLTFNSPVRYRSKGSVYKMQLTGDYHGVISTDDDAIFIKLGDALNSTPLVGASDAAISIYPTPVTYGMFISGLTDTATLGIYSMSGVKVYSSAVAPGTAVNLSRLPAGCYIAVIELSDGSRHVKRVIKH